MEKKNQKNIKEKLIGKSFTVTYGSARKYKIDDILFDRNPVKQTINYDGKSINLVKYYNTKYKADIEDLEQPLILVRSKTKNNETQNNYYIPEFCFLENLEENDVKDRDFMTQLAKYTKLDPTERVLKTNKFIELLVDPTKHKDHPEKLSAKEKSEKYGITVKPLDELFTGYIMEETKLVGGNNEQIEANERKFKVLEKQDMSHWICFFEKDYYDDVYYNFYLNLSKTSKAYNLTISEPKWVKLENNSSAKD